ncbi:MAG: ribonuclease P protein component [Myxococcaceae bacterium]|nr:ribonuclease P protein component [Myxococcaceae bacterium]
MAAAARFPKSVRLRRRAEFLKLQEGKQSVQVSAACLLALALPNGRETARLGLTVSSKVGNAVTRNRIRRHLREWFRTHIEELPKGHDVVIIARSSAAAASGEELGSAFARAASLLKKKVGA